MGDNQTTVGIPKPLMEEIRKAVEEDPREFRNATEYILHSIRTELKNGANTAE